MIHSFSFVLKQSIKYIVSKAFAKELLPPDSFLIEIKGYKHLFFGYYDVSPFAANNNRICLHGYKEGEYVDIIIYNIVQRQFEIIDRTQAWNFQQGARLSWYSENEIIYNKYSEKNKFYYCNIIDVRTKKSRQVPFPVQAIYKNDFLISIDYSYLGEIKSEYGYRKIDKNFPKGQLVFYSLIKGQHESLFSLKECMDMVEDSKGDFQWPHFNHFLINPSGSYLVFILRYYKNENRIDHLFGYDLKNSKLDLLVKSELISHCVWSNNAEVLFWGGIKRQRGYFRINIDNNKTPKMIFETEEDGHPSLISENTIITDTYPNKLLTQELYTLNLKNGEKNLLIKKRHPAFYTKNDRCDFHPSLSISKKNFQVDLINNGKRVVCVGKL